MELSVKRKTDRELIIHIKGEGHTLGNLIAKTAMANPHVVFASYRIPHPLRETMELIIEVEEGYPIDKVLMEIVGDIKKKLGEFKRLVEEKL